MNLCPSVERSERSIELNPWIDFKFGNRTELNTELELCEFNWIRFTNQVNHNCLPLS